MEIVNKLAFTVAYNLWRLKEGWPESGELVDWLVKEVVLSLRFALHGEAINGETAAVAEERKAVEAEVVSLPEPKGIGNPVMQMAELSAMASEMLAPRAAKIPASAVA